MKAFDAPARSPEQKKRGKLFCVTYESVGTISSGSSCSFVPMSHSLRPR